MARFLMCLSGEVVRLGKGPPSEGGLRVRALGGFRAFTGRTANFANGVTSVDLFDAVIRQFLW